MIAEKAQSHPRFIRQLNPSVDWTNVTAGTSLTLPNVELGSIIEYRYHRSMPNGWAYNSRWLLNDELFTREELISRFSLDGISGGNAVFNTDKLDWFNHQHLLRLTDEELLRRLEGLGLEAWGLRREQSCDPRLFNTILPRGCTSCMAN